MMLYLALILVAAGLGLILYSLFAESGARYSLPVRDRFVPNYDLDEVRSPGTPGADKRDAGMGAHGKDRGEDFLALDDEPAGDMRAEPLSADDFEIYNDTRLVELEEDSPNAHAGILEELDGEFSREHARENVSEPMAVMQAEAPESRPEAPQSNVAYLYEDSSDIVDYEQNTNVIDPTMGQYKRLKRIGKGTVQVVKDGISFSIGKNLFRFDFYKIEKAKVGDNFIALFLKGGSAVRLFIFDENSPARAEVKKGIESFFSVT